VIHVVDNGMTLCNWPWDYLSGKRKDKKVSMEKAEDATCQGCKKELKNRGSRPLRPTGTGGK
jgi:hypothetical protein